MARREYVIVKPAASRVRICVAPSSPACAVARWLGVAPATVAMPPSIVAKKPVGSACTTPTGCTRAWTPPSGVIQMQAMRLVGS